MNQVLFEHSAIKLWNDIPLNIRYLNALTNFIARLDTLISYLTSIDSRIVYAHILQTDSFTYRYHASSNRNQFISNRIQFFVI